MSNNWLSDTPASRFWEWTTGSPQRTFDGQSQNRLFSLNNNNAGQVWFVRLPLGWQVKKFRQPDWMSANAPTPRLQNPTGPLPSRFEDACEVNHFLPATENPVLLTPQQDTIHVGSVSFARATTRHYSRCFSQFCSRHKKTQFMWFQSVVSIPGTTKTFEMSSGMCRRPATGPDSASAARRKACGPDRQSVVYSGLRRSGKKLRSKHNCVKNNIVTNECLTERLKQPVGKMSYCDSCFSDQRKIPLDRHHKLVAPWMRWNLDQPVRARKEIWTRIFDWGWKDSETGRYWCCRVSGD